MTALRITLKDSRGEEQSLRCLNWPDGARMHWVRMVDGKPEMATATLALRWGRSVATGQPLLNVDWDHTTPYAGCGADPYFDDASETVLQEWADTFCTKVSLAFVNLSTLTPFADLHWHEVEAARLLTSLPRPLSVRVPESIHDGTGAGETAAEAALRGYVRDVILEQAERTFQRRVASEYERVGGVLETEPRAGSEAWKPGVPSETLAVARTKRPCWCTRCMALFDGVHGEPHVGCGKGGVARERTTVQGLSGSTAPGEPASAREAQEAFRDLGRDRYINPRDPWDQ